MKIRQLQQAHNNEINMCCSLLEKSYPDYLHPYLIYYDRAYKNYFQHLIGDDINWIFIYEENNIICGFAHFKIIENFLFLNNITVDEQYRNNGVARMLLSQGIQTITRQIPDLKEIYLDVFSKNIFALNWYLKLGMTKLEPKFWYNVIDELPLEQKEKTLVFKTDANGFGGYYSGMTCIATLLNDNTLIFRNEGHFNQYKLYFERKLTTFSALVSSQCLNFPLIETSIRMGCKLQLLSI